MQRVEKTVFISYRRANVAWALAIAQNLIHHGYDVFVDYTGINSGDFEQAILGNVRSRAHFIVLLTPIALDQCELQNDWLRREIEAALDAKLNVVPIMLEGFDFAAPAIAQKLVGPLAQLRSYNGLRVPSDYFEEAMERLRSRWLNVSLDRVLHPASTFALNVAKLQQAAVEAAPAVQEDELAAHEARERVVRLQRRNDIEDYSDILSYARYARTWTEIDCNRIRQNYRAIRQVVGETAEVMGVVKANAYGHGAIEVSRALEQEGIRWLAVGNVEEGIALRSAGIKARILVMADFLPTRRDALKEFSLTPVVYSLSDVNAVKVPYHLNIDTGLSQLGVRREVADIVSCVLQASAPIEGLMSHLASSGDYTTSQTQEQIRQFEKTVVALQNVGISPRYRHMSASIPVAYGRTEAWGNLVRVGHAIYGYVSSIRGSHAQPIVDVEPALSWKATVLAIKEVEQGSRVGYGGSFLTPVAMRVALVAAGYADGLPHRLSNRGKLIANGKFVPIIGTISMDLTIVDVTSCPDLRAGDAVTLLGSEGGVSIDAKQMARTAGTISYNVLCGINARVKRFYSR